MKNVSIVMCTCNGERYIKEQLESIVNQTYPIYELIVKDDCSTDNTIAIVRSYMQQYSFIRLVINKSRTGINCNFFSAMQLATGDFIAISDQDDIWELNKIEIQINTIGNNLLCSGFSKPFSTDGLPVAFDSRIPNHSLLRAIYVGILPGHTMLMHKQLLKYIPANSLLTYDMQLQIAAAAMNSIVFIDKILVNQRRHITAATYTQPANHRLTPGNIGKKIWETIQFYKEIKPFMQQRFCIIVDFLERLPIKNKEVDKALTMARLQTQRTWKSWYKLTLMCIKERDQIFYVKEQRKVIAVLRAMYFPIFCSYYYRYHSKNFQRYNPTI